MSEVIKLNEDMIGNKVRCIYKADCYHPEIGTIGTIVDYDKRDEDANYKVQWPKGTTIGDDRWWAINRCIELVEDDVTNEQKISEMTNKEIWEMLKPKMEKNGLKTYYRVTPYHHILSYDCVDAQKAIAIAYRSGYERAMKGRPFKFGEKKKGGHWEPVDPNNLPKEGTRVRYAREDKEYKEIPLIALGDSGTFALGKVSLLPGIKFDDGRFWDWICFNGAEDCLDMWVEDDE